VLALLGKVSRLRRRLEESEQRCRRAVQVSRAARDARAAGRALVELASTLLSRQQLDEASLSASAATQILDVVRDAASAPTSAGLSSFDASEEVRFAWRVARGAL
jgi:hypothetical protein